MKDLSARYSVFLENRGSLTIPTLSTIFGLMSHADNSEIETTRRGFYSAIAKLTSWASLVYKSVPDSFSIAPGGLRSTDVQRWISHEIRLRRLPTLSSPKPLCPLTWRSAAVCLTTRPRQLSRSNSWLPHRTIVPTERANPRPANVNSKPLRVGLSHFDRCLCFLQEY